MNRKFLEVLLNWPRVYLTGTDIHQILNKSPDSRQAILKRAIQEKYLIPLRRDLFLVKNHLLSHIQTFEIAPLIYGPSYISFESALSFHGWIPEGVQTTVSATVKRSKEFATPIGIFSYEHIPISAFQFEVEQHATNQVTLWIASPLKAIADMIYTRKRLWNSIKDISQDLRIEMENFEKIDPKNVNELAENYPSARVKKILRFLA